MKRNATYSFTRGFRYETRVTNSIRIGEMQAIDFGKRRDD